jgi:hypothetical protein
MPVSFIAARNLSGLRPVDAHGVDLLAKIKQGQQVEIIVKRARNGRQHRLYWALIGLIHPQQRLYTTQEQLSNAMKCAVGWCDEVPLNSGKVMVTPRSISFANMDQTEFQQFFDKIIDLVVEKILPGVTSEDLKRELEEIVN